MDKLRERIGFILVFIPGVDLTATGEKSPSGMVVCFSHLKSLAREHNRAMTECLPHNATTASAPSPAATKLPHTPPERIHNPYPHPRITIPAFPLFSFSPLP
jgi:hypothetical protein